ncbi:MAG: GldG family protein [Clostridia bacterium]|nr:GldG family protein [Clostridia bacterium]
MKHETKTKNARALRAGGYSILITAIVLAALIFVNLIVAALPASVTRLDATSAGLYTLDGQTKQILSAVSEDITLYHVCQDGKEDSRITELLGRYAAANGRITVKTVDPVVSPAFVAKYTEDSLADNSVIVESGKRFKIVPYSEMIYTDYSNITEEEYYYYIYYGVQPTGTPVFAGENALTSAVDFVTVPSVPKLYVLSGHGETALSTTVTSYIEEENFELETISLLTSSSSSGEPDTITDELSGITIKVPEDASCILINVPTSDLSEPELTALLDYLKNGGTIVVAADYRTADLSNMLKLANALGLEIPGSLVIETAQSYYTQAAYWLLPKAQSHEITDPLISAQKSVLFANAHAMTEAETLPDGVTVTPLFLTSTEAVAKVTTSFQLAAYEEGDLTGQFITAAAVTVGEGKAVWFTSPYLSNFDSILSRYIGYSADQMTSGGNSGAFLNALGWTCEKPSSVTIRTIEMTVEPLTVAESSANFWMVLLAILVPVSALGAGLLIWARRRRR